MDTAVEALGECVQQGLEARAHGWVPLLRYPAMALGFALAGIVTLRREAAAYSGSSSRYRGTWRAPIRKKRSWICRKSFL